MPFFISNKEESPAHTLSFHQDSRTAEEVSLGLRQLSNANNQCDDQEDAEMVWTC